ncbi:hypothetical protein AAG906_005966 [Vitis piasezkii]
MASSASHMIIVILLVLAVSSALFSPAANGFRVSLRHVDSGGNYTKWDRLQRAAKTASFEPSVEAPVHAGNGEFLMNLAIGTPAETYSAIMDTGSDLIWTQCKPCKVCFDQPTPIFDPEKSSSFSKPPCSSDLCVALPNSSCSDGCEYRYSYGDNSSTQGVLATETFTFGDASVPKIGFGCGKTTTDVRTARGRAGGARPRTTVIDFPASYCEECNPHPIGPKPFTFIILLPFLEGISVGDTFYPSKIHFSIQDDGSGGLIIDSGTTITYLKDSAFMKLDVDASDSTEIDLCFTLPPDGSPVDVPQLVFHFEGVDLKLPKENYIIEDSALRRVSIFGNLQQQNIVVLHDLEKETISFAPAQCNQL